MKEKRFEVIYKQTSANSVIRILKDNQTGVEYLYYGIGYGAGLIRY